MIFGSGGCLSDAVQLKLKREFLSRKAVFSVKLRSAGVGAYSGNGMIQRKECKGRRDKVAVVTDGPELRDRIVERGEFENSLCGDSLMIQGGYFRIFRAVVIAGFLGLYRMLVAVGYG